MKDYIVITKDEYGYYGEVVSAVNKFMAHDVMTDILENSGRDELIIDMLLNTEENRDDVYSAYDVEIETYEEEE